MASAASHAGNKFRPGAWYHLCLRGFCENPSWCSLVVAKEAVHQFFIILEIRVFQITNLHRSSLAEELSRFILFKASAQSFKLLRTKN